MPARVAILLSGRGSNFLALHGAMERGEIPAEIAVVIANVAEAQGLEKARSLRLPTVCIPHKLEPSRWAHEEKVITAIDNAEAEWICLAGYMRLLSAAFVDRFPERILNIHPALLPSFPGMDAQQQAVDWGVKVSGCTGRSSCSGQCRCTTTITRSPFRHGSWPKSTRPIQRLCAAWSANAGASRAGV